MVERADWVAIGSSSVPVAADPTNRLEPDLTIGPPSPPEVRTAPGERAQIVELEDAPQVDENGVRILVKGIGGALGQFLGDDDVADHWRFTDKELDDLVPPLTRIVNRNNRLRRAVLKGDSITVAVHMAGYAGRNVDLARAARKERDERQGQAGGTAVDGGADGAGLSGGSQRADGRDGWGHGGLSDPASGGVG